MKFCILLCLSFIGVATCGDLHSVVTPDILHHVSKVLSHGYGTKVVLGYPEKAHLVDYGHSVHVEPYYGHGYGHHHDHGHHHHHHDHGYYGHALGQDLGYYGHGHGHGHGHLGHSHVYQSHGHGHSPAYFGGYGHNQGHGFEYGHHY